MRVTAKVQLNLCQFYRTEDGDQWFAVCCRRGLEELLGRKLRSGETVEMTLGADDVNVIQRKDAR
jgi:hypothetical protein